MPNVFFSGDFVMDGKIDAVAILLQKSDSSNRYVRLLKNYNTKFVLDYPPLFYELTQNIYLIPLTHRADQQGMRSTVSSQAVVIKSLFFQLDNC